MECRKRLRVGVHAENASVSGFACRPFEVLASQNNLWKSPKYDLFIVWNNLKIASENDLAKLTQSKKSK